MFTGIVRALGRVRALRRNRTGARLEVAPPRRLAARRGDSVCVNGVCLTAAVVSARGLSFDLVRETLERSNLGALAAGDEVNLEPSLTLRDPLGGHLVMGHVDAVGTIVSKKPLGDGALLRVETAPEATSMLAVKGSVALDGVSLTLTAVEKGALEAALVPFTLRNTTLGRKGRGARLNVEVDMLARYVHAFAGARRPSGLVTKELLRKAGFLE
jgi:riboflavin synthase alpha subunit